MPKNTNDRAFRKEGVSLPAGLETITFRTEDLHRSTECETTTGDDDVIYRDDHYELGRLNGVPYLRVDGRRFVLSSHPYEPCLYIAEGNGLIQTSVHNAFDPLHVLEAFRAGRTVTSITGFEYDARDFCRMVAYASGRGNININEAEETFGNRSKGRDNRDGLPTGQDSRKDFGPEGREQPLGRMDRGIVEDAGVSSVLSDYPDIVVDYCLVTCGQNVQGYSAHRRALETASRMLLTDPMDAEASWHYDCGQAVGEQIDPEVLFIKPKDMRGVNYYGAFVFPPHGGRRSDMDFEHVNRALFSKGTSGLEVYEWTTDWSDYFDDGHEWWGAVCYTVYDKLLERFVVIMASATD